MKRLLFLILLIIFTSNLFAQFKINLEVSAKGKKRIPVILEKFTYPEANFNLKAYADKIYTIIKNDLQFSDEITFKENNAEFKVSGDINYKKNEIQFKLVVRDLFLKQDSLIKYYYGSKNVLTRIAHSASNDILYTITGKKSLFEYKILFVDDKTGTKQIYLMDYDGLNIKRLTFSNSIETYPELIGNYLIYTSFETGNPRVFIKNLSTGIKKILIKKGDFSAGADISPDGKLISAMVGVKGSTNIGLFYFNGKFIKFISPTIFDEVSPRWSHDGKKLAFVSDRAGSPQIYVYNFSTNIVKRISFGSKYSCYPCWGAKDQYIYYSSFNGKNYTIYRTSINYFHIEELTEGEYPDISKDNKFMVFTKNVNGYNQIFIMNLETGKLLQVTKSKSNKYSPRWYYGKY